MGMAGTTQAFIMPIGAPVASKGKLSGFDEPLDRTMEAGAQQWGRYGTQREFMFFRRAVGSIHRS
jgi:hypothetical protein